MSDSKGKLKGVTKKEVKHLWEMTPDDVKRTIRFVKTVQNFKEKFIREGIEMKPVEKTKTKELRLLKNDS